MEKTSSLFKDLSEKCEFTIKAMWFLEGKIGEMAQKENRELPPQKSFILAYFRRNTVYLNASYILGSIGFNNPSQNVQRTVYETILRGYYFLVEPEEANRYYSVLATNQKNSFLRRRQYYGHKFLCQKLFKLSLIHI